MAMGLQSRPAQLGLGGWHHAQCGAGEIADADRDDEKQPYVHVDCGGVHMRVPEKPAPHESFRITRKTVWSLSQ